MLVILLHILGNKLKVKRLAKNFTVENWLQEGSLTRTLLLAQHVHEQVEDRRFGYKPFPVKIDEFLVITIL